MPDPDRDDLAAMFTRLARRLAEAEEPLLDRHGLVMWEYIVLSHITRQTVPNQLTLARAINYDKTRLIRVLDDLQHRGLIERKPDPTDRRSHNISITAAGRRAHKKARAAIHKMESTFLENLDPTEQQTLRSLLSRISDTHSR